MMANAVVHERPSDYETTPDYDGLWKTLIEDLFEEFMQFFAPDLYEEIDFSKDHNFLKQELFKEIIQGKKGRVAADQIVKVHLKSGQERWILIHIEVQGKTSKDFAQRMFRYFYRIYDKYNREIYAIALLTDAEHSSHSNHFHYSFHGTEIDYKYNVYSFHNKDIKRLEESSNPFSDAVIAGIYASQTKHDENKRYAFKRKLMIKILQKTSTQPERIRTYLSALFQFIDNLLQVPGDLNKKLKEDIIPYIRKEATQQMLADKRKPSQTLAEIFAELKAEGMEKGREEAAKNFAKELLRESFSNEQIAKLTNLKQEEVVKLRNSL